MPSKGSVPSRRFLLPVSCRGDVGGCIFAALHQRASFGFAGCVSYKADCPLMNNPWATGAEPWLLKIAHVFVLMLLRLHSQTGALHLLPSLSGVLEFCPSVHYMFP